MHLFKKPVLSTLLLVAGILPVSADDNADHLLINEIMQSNIDCIMDDLKEFPDSWVELYNPGDAAVSLADYAIGTKEKAGKAYKLPSQMVPPKGYVVIYCDKEETGLHTDFRLESGKDCVLYLFKGGEIVDRLPEGMKKQPAPNIAYGRKTDGAAKWDYQLTPTPGKANTGKTCGNKQILGEPKFSEKGRVVSGNLNVKLELSVPDGSPEGTVIRYTVNGEEPTEKSPEYKNPISITKSTVILAKLFCDGWLSPRATAQSYINHGRNITLPVISIATKDAYLNDSKIGIFANNDGTDEKKNDWRRPINIEFFFTPDDPSSINQLCETRVAGGISRGAKFKTLAVYANKRFGTKRLEYEFFPEDKPGLTDFKSIMLRNAGNDFDYLYMRDAVIQRSAATHIDDWQGYRPAIVYINGKYYGMLNIRERSNEDNIYTNYDGLEDIDMFENWGELKEGTWDNYNAFKEFYNEKNHTQAEYEQWMDVDEFFNLFIVNLYHVNLDFPGNNIVMWRPTAKDGKWRWIMKDTDFGLGLYGRANNYKIFDWLYNPSYDPANAWANQSDHTRLFRRLMDIDAFKQRFVDRCFIYCGDFLNAKGIREVWDPMYNAIKFEYPYHRKLINQWWPNYNDELNNARNWVSQRTANFINNLCSYYGLGSPTALKINQGVEGAADAGISFNGVRLSKGTFDGKYIAGRDIVLEGDPESGKTITGWKVIANGATKDYQGSKLEIQMPQSGSVTIMALLATSGISDCRISDTTDAAVYDLNGRKLSASSLEGLPKGIYIIGGKKVVK